MKDFIIYLKKIKNTFLTPRWNTVYSNFDNFFLKTKKNKYFFWFLSKFWFLPYDINLRYWHTANENSNHAYNHYQTLDEKAKLLLEKVKKYSINKDIKILDLGCNVGRHLNSLKKSGYNNLYGVDIGKMPVTKSKELFFNLKDANIDCASFENYLFNAKNNFFEIIYTHGATIELTKPTFPLISHISRVLKINGFLIILINENGHNYPRFWRYEFEKNNLILEYIEKLNENHTLFVLNKKIANG